MGLPYEAWIGLRYMKVRGRELFISLITWISVGGVALGVMALVVVLSVMTGFEQDLRAKILGANAHVTVRSLEGTLKEPQVVAETIRSVDGVEGATPFVMGQVMMMTRGRSSGAVLRGVDVDTVGDVLDIDRFMTVGRVGEIDTEGPGVFIGREMSRNMGLFVGDKISVVTPSGTASLVGMIPRMRTFRVAGVFHTGMYEYDTTFLFVSLASAKDFLRLGDGVHGIEVKVDDIYHAGEVSGDIATVLGPSFWTRDWMQTNRNLFSALKLEKLVMFIILTLIVLVAAFNIASTLIMVVMEKGRDIGILKSMGATNRSIRRIFVFEGLVIGGVGTAAGLIGGWLLCFLLERYQFIELPGDVYYIDTLPVVMEPQVFALVAVCAVGLCFLATLYPSWQASRLDPVEIIRYE